MNANSKSYMRNLFEGSSRNISITALLILILFLMDHSELNFPVINPLIRIIISIILYLIIPTSITMSTLEYRHKEAYITDDYEYYFAIIGLSILGLFYFVRGFKFINYIIVLYFFILTIYAAIHIKKQSSKYSESNFRTLLLNVFTLAVFYLVSIIMAQGPLYFK